LAYREFNFANKMGFDKALVSYMHTNRNRIRQNDTIMDKQDSNTGLTPIQERAVCLLVAGKSYTDVSKELKVNRSTLYTWSKKITFRTYYNRLIEETQVFVEDSLRSIGSSAIQAIIEILNDDQKSPTRLKAACWTIEKILSREVGETDPRDIFRRQSTIDMWSEMEQSTFYEDQYNELCKRHGIDP
jgi:hypothetical protein